MNYKLLLALVVIPFIFIQDEKDPQQPKLPKHFTQRLGTFKAEMTFYAAPGQVAFQASGTQVNKLTCGDLWLEEDLIANIGGQAFQGRGATTFDAKTKQATGTWYDSMSTHLMIPKGKLSADKKTLTQKADVMTDSGQVKPARLETILLDEKRYEFRMYILGGKADFLSMKILYTKK